jgi:hypothetical protein
MKNQLLFLLLGPLAAIFSPQATSANDLSVIDVRRNIPMSDSDPIYRDYFINAGDGDGMKKNLVVTAMRKISVRDASGSQSYGEILIPVGRLKIIAVYSKIAVAREWESISREESPMLEQTGIMTGDKIDLSGSYIDKKRKSALLLSPMAAPAEALSTAEAPNPSTPPLLLPSDSVKAAEKPAVPVEMLDKRADSGNNNAL